MPGIFHHYYKSVNYGNRFYPAWLPVCYFVQYIAPNIWQLPNHAMHLYKEYNGQDVFKYIILKVLCEMFHSLAC